MTIWNAVAGGAAAFNIETAGGFNGSSHMTRTWSATPTNNQIYTFSFWIKKSINALDQQILFVLDSTGNQGFLHFDSSDRLEIFHQVGSVNIVRYTSTRVFRDVSSWYHIVWTTDATLATEHNRFYVNGEEITIWDIKTQPAGTYTPWINRASYTHYIGRFAGSATQFVDGYMADVNFIDGQVVDPTEFGELDNNGIWIPKKYLGTYGDDGFLLEFQNSGAQGEDSSGNGNTFTNTGVNQREDTPTKNTSTLNVNHKGVDMTVSDAGTVATNTAVFAAWNTAMTTVGIHNGKWYWENQPTVLSSQNYYDIGIVLEQFTGEDFAGSDTLSYGIQFFDTNTNIQLSHNGVGVSTVDVGVNLIVNDIVMIAYDVDIGSIWIGLNGTWLNSGDPENGINALFTGIFVGESRYKIPAISLFDNGTQAVWIADPALQTYPAPTGFNILSPTNLPAPDIDIPSDYFDTLLWTGDGVSPRDISGLDFSPNLVIVKGRTTASSATNNLTGDTERGGNASLFTNLTNAESINSNGYISDFNLDGFELTEGPGGFHTSNESGVDYVGWCWQEGAVPGLDIVLYTGTGANRTVPHNLGAIPEMMIVKNRSEITSWNVYHGYTSATPQNDYLFLNGTAQVQSDITRWNNTAPTDTEFTVGTATATNGASDLMVAYLFTSVPGFSKMGYYIGNGTTNGPYVYTGFKPKYVLIKNTTVAASWHILDTPRSIEFFGGNPMQRFLLADSSQIESVAATLAIDFYSNGFKLRQNGGGTNTNGNRYVYLAFAEHPFNYANAF